jgi:hypothetical protein
MATPSLPTESPFTGPSGPLSVRAKHREALTLKCGPGGR